MAHIVAYNIGIFKKFHKTEEVFSKNGIYRQIEQ